MELRIFNRLKCTLANKQTLRSYYEGLSKEQLKARKKSTLNTYLATSIAWSSALLTIAIVAKMGVPLFILYVGVTISLLITTWTDYRHRISLINQILKSK